MADLGVRYVGDGKTCTVTYDAAKGLLSVKAFNFSTTHAMVEYVRSDKDGSITVIQGSDRVIYYADGKVETYKRGRLLSPVNGNKSAYNKTREDMKKAIQDGERITIDGGRVISGKSGSFKTAFLMVK